MLAVLMMAPAIVYAVPGTIDVDIDGSPATINYDAEGVQINSIEADLDFISLVLQVDVPDSPGILEITFERSFFDYVNDIDDSFIIIADGDEPTFEETSTTAESRTLRIELPQGTEEVEIVGTEFGELEIEDPAPVDPEPEEPVVEDPAPVVEPAADSAPAEPATDSAVADSCGPGTILKDGTCVLDQTCGPGTVFKDGTCVLDATEKAPPGRNRDLIVGAAAAIIIAFAVIIPLWIIGRASKSRSADVASI